MNYFEHILGYAKKLIDEGLASNVGDTIAVRNGNDLMYITKPDADFRTLTEADICEVNYRVGDSPYTMLFDAYPEIKVIFHLHSPYIQAMSDVEKAIPPVLDDMAQIVGTKADIVKKNEARVIVKALKKKSSVLIAKNGAIITGRTFNECHTTARVLEKSALVYATSELFGGARTIPFHEAVIMRLVYKMKYSKKNQENKQQEEQND